MAQFDAPCDAFGRIVTADYTAENEACSSAIRSSWASIDNVTSNRKKNIYFILMLEFFLLKYYNSNCFLLVGRGWSGLDQQRI